jgi:hypothetical protein
MKELIDTIDDLFSEDESYVDLSKIDSSVTDWTDTGNYAINFIISNSFFKGYPLGRISALEGRSGTGKSLFLASSLRNPDLSLGLVLESEGGGFSKELLNFMKVDASKIRQKKVRTYDSLKYKDTGTVESIKDSEVSAKGLKEGTQEAGLLWSVRKIIDTIVSKKDKGTVILGVDSVANITSVQELTGSRDMGRRNQLLNQFFRLFDNIFEKLNIACILTNKLYTDLNAGEYEEKYISWGGTPMEYNPSLIIRLEKAALSNYLGKEAISDEKENLKSSRGASIVCLKAKITKSRFGTFGRSVYILLDLNTGLIRSSGIFNICDDYGLLEKVGARYKFKNDKIYDKSFYRKNFESEVFTEDKLKMIEKEIHNIQKKYDIKKVENTLIEEEEKIKNEELTELIENIDNE